MHGAPDLSGAAAADAQEERAARRPTTDDGHPAASPDGDDGHADNGFWMRGSSRYFRILSLPKVATRDSLGSSSGSESAEDKTGFRPR